jgi:hypothetical protein
VSDLEGVLAAGTAARASSGVPELPSTLYHFADAANARSIERHGLLSTAELLRRNNVDGATMARVSEYRHGDIELPGGERIRNQAPMPPGALAGCLDPGLLPNDWYRLINGHVFFWLDLDRVRRHGRALRTRPQLLLAVDTNELLAAYEDRAFVTPFNVGNARRRPARRGLRTLCPVARWRREGWKHEAMEGERPRASSHPPAELLVSGAIPDIHRFVRRIERVDPW